MEEKRNTFFNRISEYAAPAPALMLCAATFIMLILDIFVPAMNNAQYQLYPVLIRIVGLLGIPCAGVCLISDIIRSRLRLNAASILFILFGIWMIIVTFVNDVSEEAVFGVAYRYVGVYDIVLFMTVYMYCSGRIQTEQLRDKILICIMLLSDLIAAAFIFDGATGLISAFHGRREPAAIFFHGNHYGYFLAIAVVISAGYFLLGRGRRSVLGISSMGINMIALALNRTIGSVLAAGLVVLLMIITTIARERSRKAWVLLGASSALLLTALVFIGGFRNDIAEILTELKGIGSGTNNIYAGNGRWGIWQYTCRFIAGSPVWGYGCEGIRDVLYEFALTGSPHNEILTYAAYFGIPGAVLYSAAVITVLVSGLGNSDRSMTERTAAFAALGYFVSSFFGLAMFYTAPFFFVVLGMSKNNK